MWVLDEFATSVNVGIGPSWRMDETYMKVKSEWRYVYRAVDKHGQTIDLLLTEHRD